MPAIDLHLDGDGCWPDLAGTKPTRGEIVGVTTLPNGTNEGNPTVTIRINLPDGSTVLAETTVRLWLSAAAAMRGRYGEP